MERSSKPIIKHIPDFLDYCEVEKGLRDNTQKNYGRYLNVFIKWLKIEKKESLLPYQLSPEDIWNYRLYLARRYKTSSGKSLAKITQNYYLIALRALLDYFTDRDIESLPSGKIKLPKDTKEKPVKFLALDQVQQLLETPNISTKSGLRDRAIIETLFSTGLRIAELIALNREQIHFKDPDGLELSITGKGERTRTVYFSPRALHWIKEYLENRAKSTSTMDDEKALFINYRTRSPEVHRLSARAVQKAISHYARLAGLPITVTPHVLRHSYATDLLIEGVDLRTVQEFLGHKNIATTQIYTHITNKRLKEIHKKFHGGNKLKDN